MIWFDLFLRLLFGFFRIQCCVTSRAKWFSRNKCLYCNELMARFGVPSSLLSIFAGTSMISMHILSAVGTLLNAYWYGHYATNDYIVLQKIRRTTSQPSTIISWSETFTKSASEESPESMRVCWWLWYWQQRRNTLIKKRGPKEEQGNYNSYDAADAHWISEQEGDFRSSE